jgi:DNA-binding NtrC family response regulator
MLFISFEMTSLSDKLRVLIIEDDASITEQLTWFLADSGIGVAGTCATLPGAMMAVNGEFAIALVDVNLGGNYSYPVMDKLSQRGIPFIVMTGYAPEEMPREYAASPSLMKPFEPSALLQMIKRLTSAE